MKATHTKTPPTFTPVTINITCETQEELDAMYMLTNHAFILDAIADVTSRETARNIEAFRRAICKAEANTLRFDAFSDRAKQLFKERSRA